MTYTKALAHLAIPIFLLLLTAIAGFSFSEIGFLSLPIPKALTLFTVVLPFITGISMQGTNGMVRRFTRSTKKQNLPSLALIAIIGFQLMYETIIATLAMTYIVPASALECPLSDQWGKLSKARNDKAILAIQERFKCCGFRTTKDRAFPWGSPSTCAARTGRDISCLGPWLKAEQANAGWLLFVAASVFILKILLIVFLFTRPAWAERFLPVDDLNDEETEEDNRFGVRRLIENGNAEESYHDGPDDESPPVRAIEAPDTNGPIVQPSQLGTAGHEWREEGEARES